MSGLPPGSCQKTIVGLLEWCNGGSGGVGIHPVNPIKGSGEVGINPVKPVNSGKPRKLSNFFK